LLLIALDIEKAQNKQREPFNRLLLFTDKIKVSYW